MNAVTRPIERSVISVLCAESDQARIQEISSVANPVKRAGLLALHKAVAVAPNIFAAKIGLTHIPYEDMEFINQGYQSIVFRGPNDSVVKVVKEYKEGKPARLSHEERVQLAREMTIEHEAMATIIGPTVLPHTIKLQPFRFVDSMREAICVTQPYKDLEFLTLSTEDPEEYRQLPDKLAKNESKYPGTLATLRSILDGNDALWQDHGLVIDIVGKDNVGIDSADGKVYIVDAQPVPAARKDEQNLAKHHIQKLGVALQAVY